MKWWWLLVLFPALGGWAATQEAPKTSEPAWKEAAEASRKREASAGAALFRAHCADCHENAATGAPAKSTLELSLPVGAIYEVLTTGRMREIAAPLSDPQRREIAEYLAKSKISASPPR